MPCVYGNPKFSQSAPVQDSLGVDDEDSATTAKVDAVFHETFSLKSANNSSIITQQKALKSLTQVAPIDNGDDTADLTHQIPRRTAMAHQKHPNQQTMLIIQKRRSSWSSPTSPLTSLGGSGRRSLPGSYEESLFSGRVSAATVQSPPIHFVCQLTVSGRVRASSFIHASNNNSGSGNPNSTRFYTRHFVVPFAAHVHSWPTSDRAPSVDTMSSQSSSTIRHWSINTNGRQQRVRRSMSESSSPLSGGVSGSWSSHILSTPSSSMADGGLHSINMSQHHHSFMQQQHPQRVDSALGTPFLGTISLAHARSSDDGDNRKSPASGTTTNSNTGNVSTEHTEGGTADTIAISHFFSSMAIQQRLQRQRPQYLQIPTPSSPMPTSLSTTSSISASEEPKMIRVPMKGQLQLIIRHAGSPVEILSGDCGRTGTGVAKVFLIPYDFTGMTAGSRTFLRQKVYWTPSASSTGESLAPSSKKTINLETTEFDSGTNAKKNSSNDQRRGPLRHGVHLTFFCSSSPQPTPNTGSIPSTPSSSNANRKDGSEFTLTSNGVSGSFAAVNDDVTSPSVISPTVKPASSKKYLYLCKSVRVIFGHRAAWPQEESFTVYEGPYGEWMPGDTTKRRF